jgi:hypothetical protein
VAAGFGRADQVGRTGGALYFGQDDGPKTTGIWEMWATAVVAESEKK